MDTLSVLWFILIAVLWTGYLVLEGFDFGVGMLMSIFPRGDATAKAEERRVLVNTIGPTWDGAEVWLLTAGGATFAAFPEWYATLFSGFYLPLFLILLALIVRVVAFEYRGKIASATWAKRFDWLIMFGSWLPALLWGVAFANLVRGVELVKSNVNNGHEYVGGFWALLNPFAILGGLTTLVLFLLHGLLFVTLKTEGDLRIRARAMAKGVGLAAIVIAGAWAVWAQIAFSAQAWTWAAVAVAALCLIGVWLTNAAGREGLAFTLSAVTMVAAVALIFGSMFPDVMPGLGGGESLTIAEATSTHYTLTVMTWVAVILTPIVLAYQIWTFHVFKRRLSSAALPPPAGLTWKKVKDALGASATPLVKPSDVA
jgi:cytochrome d ubiquinol oxidase subunit II